MVEQSKKIIVFEPNMNGPAHTEINAGFIKIIQKLYSEHELIFIADAEHLKLIQDKINMDRWELKPIEVTTFSPKKFIQLESKLMFRLTKILISNNNIEKIFLLGILPISQIYVSIINHFLDRDIVIALHGQMEVFLKENKIGFTRYYHSIPKYLYNSNDHIKYIVFGESIAKNIGFLFKREKLLVIDQPYIMNKVIKFKTAIKYPITIGVVGRADKSKNINELFKLLELLEYEIKNNLIKVKIVGKLYEKLDDKYINSLSYFTETISNELLESEIQTLDFALSFTDKNYYKAIPSGVLFDCIKWNLPILGLKNDYISYYFSRYGKFGELFDTTEEMANFLKQLLIELEPYNDSIINEYNKSFIKLKEALDLDNIAQEFGKQL